MEVSKYKHPRTFVASHAYVWHPCQCRRECFVSVRIVAENKLSAGTRNEERREEKANWDAKSTCSLETKKSFLVREHGWQLFVCSILDKLSFGNYFAFPLTFLSIDSLHLTSLSLGSPVLLSTFFHSRFFEIFLRRTNHLCFPLYQQVLSSSASPRAHLYPCLYIQL